MGLFNNMFNKRFIGSMSREEFTVDDLPKTRLELFWAMFKIRVGKLVPLNFFTLIFFAPVIVWLISTVFVLSDVAEQLSAGAITEAQATNLSTGTWSMTLLVLIPLLMIAGLGIAGMLRVVRNWARDENAWVWHDFWVGIRDNWKQALVMMFINGAVLWLGYTAMNFYAVMAESNSLFTVLQTVALAVVILLFMMNLYAFPLMVYYKLRFLEVLRNSLLLMVARLPYSLLFGVVTLLPLILVFLSPMIGLLYIACYALSFHGFILTSYTNATFERFINIRIEGAPVGAGMRPSSSDEYYDDEDDEDEEGNA